MRLLWFAWMLVGAAVLVTAQPPSRASATSRIARDASASGHQIASRPTHEAVFPLKPSADHRYLVDQRNVPFLVVGDSPQALLVRPSEQEALRYLATRRAQGFNAVWINLLCDIETGGQANGVTQDGIRPFSKGTHVKFQSDIATPNEAYFARVDRIVRAAGRLGMAVFLDPAETKGWLDELRAAGTTKSFAYGRYLGRRYSRFPNIVWLNGNDFQTWKNKSDDDAVIAVARGILSADKHHVQTVELNYFVSSSLDDVRWKSIVGLNSVYTYSPTYAEMWKQYFRTDHIPNLLIEANYEQENHYTGPQTLRRQEYWALLAGAAGQFWGNKYTWQFISGWRQHVSTTGSRQLGYAASLFSRLPWYELVPDRDHAVVTAGYGTFSDEGDVNANDFAPAARTPDGKLAVVYMPTGRTITIDTSRLASPPRARWFDPTTGTYRTALASASSDTSAESFTPPAKNGEGESDWVLVLTA
jgi:hypothetical protein